MSFISGLVSAIRKISIVALVAATFLLGVAGAFLFSVYSPEVKVPNVVGKEMPEGESELAHYGLKLRKRATRYSADTKPNTILDQSPHPGETIKSGQTVAVVISRATANEGETSVSVNDAQATPTPAAENVNGNSGSGNGNTRNGNRNRNANSSNANTGNRNSGTATNQNRNTNGGNRNSSNGNRNANSGANRNSNSNTNPGTGHKPPATHDGTRDRVVNKNGQVP